MAQQPAAWAMPSGPKGAGRWGPSRLPDPSPATARHALEIGPGLGVLTAALLERRARLAAVEVDLRLAAHLRSRFAAEIADGSLRLVEGDALDIPIEGLVGPPYDLVANLPYHTPS